MAKPERTLAIEERAKATGRGSQGRACQELGKTGRGLPMAFEGHAITRPGHPMEREVHAKDRHPPA